MIRSFVMLVVLTLLVSFGLGYLFQSAYPFVLASETARKSVEVSEEQMAELKGAALASDRIAFAIIGALLCGTLPLVVSGPSSSTKKIAGAGVGLLLGGGLGAVAGWFGHWFYANPSIEIADAMMYFLLRWTLMLLPLAIAAAISSTLASGNIKLIPHSLVGAVLGAVAASALYSVLSGTVTTIEGREKILPFFFGNRVLILAATCFCIGAGILLQLQAKKSLPVDLKASVAN